MTTKLADDLRQALAKCGGTPLHLVDTTTGASYVLMPANQFEKFKAIAEGDEIETMYPLLADIEADDWEDISHYDRKP